MTCLLPACLAPLFHPRIQQGSRGFRHRVFRAFLWIFSKFHISSCRLLFPESHQWKKQPSVCRNYIRGAVLRYRYRTCSVPPDFALYE